MTYRICSALKEWQEPEVRQNTKQWFHTQNDLLLHSKDLLNPQLLAPNSTKGTNRAQDKGGGPTRHWSLNGKVSYHLTTKAKWELRTRHPTETTGLAWEIVEVVEKVSREMSRALGLDERVKKQNFAKFSLPFLYSSHGKNRTFHVLHWA